MTVWKNQADHRPRDGNIFVSEWLRYAAEQVPELYLQTDSDEKELRGALEVT